MANSSDEAAERAAQLTNKQLAGELAQLGPLSVAKLDQLLPEKRDKEEFAKLMAVVQSETDKDKQLAYLENNLQTAGGMVLKLLKYFV